jgi:hypothetical protein
MDFSTKPATYRKMIFMCGYAGWEGEQRGEGPLDRFVLSWETAKGASVGPIHATELLSSWAPTLNTVAARTLDGPVAGTTAANFAPRHPNVETFGNSAEPSRSTFPAQPPISSRNSMEYRLLSVSRALKTVNLQE